MRSLQKNSPLVSQFDKRGYTLVELVIVLGVVSAFAMLSWPVLMKPWQRNETQQAAESIREVLGEARIAAMNGGYEVRFRWKANTNEYEVRSRDPLPKSVAKNEVQPQLPTQHDSKQHQPMPTREQAFEMLLRHGNRNSDQRRMEHKWLVRHTRLPFDSIFFDGRAIETAFFHDDVDETGSRKEWTPFSTGRPDDELRQRRDRMQAWKEISFYPDGRCSNQTFTIRGKNEYEVQVELRGFTGGITLSQARRVKRQSIDLNKIDDIDMDNLANEIVPETDKDANSEIDLADD